MPPYLANSALFKGFDCMNRKKKISDIWNKKLKKAKSHMNPKANNNKPKYISKADRAKMALEQAEATQPKNSEAAGITEVSDAK